MSIKTKQINQHSNECYAIKEFEKGVWDTPWAFIGKTVWLDKNGGNRGKTTMWQIICCNCTHCSAKLLVRVDDILALLPPHNQGLPPKGSL